MFPTATTEAEFVQSVQGVPARVGDVFFVSQVVS
jgi:hypothetical protein